MPIKIPYLLRRDWQQQVQINELYQNQRFIAFGPSVVTQAPFFVPGSVSFSSATLAVDILNNDPTAVNYYTTDGTTPNTGSPVALNPIILTGTTALRSMSQAPGKLPSSVTVALYNKVSATGTIYWGWSALPILNEAQVLALVGTTVDTDPFGNRLFPPAPSDNFASFWWPTSFVALSPLPDGFKLFGFGIPMAGAAEGFTSVDSAGYNYAPLTVNDVLGNQYRSLLPLGGPGNQTIIVQ
jgi:hypothetical protein